MTQEWRDAYEAGIFTEFMEQRDVYKRQLQQCDHHDKPGKGIPGLSLVEFHQGIHIVLALRRLAAGKYAVYQVFQHITEPFPVL